MPFASSSMDVLMVKCESEIFAIFLVYVSPYTRPAALKIHGLIDV